MIEIESLEQRYGKHVALRVPSLRIEPGVTSLVGHNGAGKSTLLLVTAGLLRPTVGSVRIEGHLAGSVKARELVSFVPDQPAMFDDLTLEDQMLYIARLHGQDKPNKVALDLLDMFDFWDLVERFPRAMSKGQRQKASLLVATARPCSVLLTDEPTTGFDADSRDDFIAGLGAMVEAGMSVISSTHDEALIEGSDRILHLEGGTVVGAPSPSQEGPSASEDSSEESADVALKPGQRPSRWDH